MEHFLNVMTGAMVKWLMIFLVLALAGVNQGQPPDCERVPGIAEKVVKWHPVEKSVIYIQERVKEFRDKYESDKWCGPARLCVMMTYLSTIDRIKNQWNEIPKKYQLDLQALIDVEPNVTSGLPPKFCSEVQSKIEQLIRKARSMSKTDFSIGCHNVGESIAAIVPEYDSTDKTNCARLFGVLRFANPFYEVPDYDEDPHNTALHEQCREYTDAAYETKLGLFKMAGTPYSCF